MTPSGSLSDSGKALAFSVLFVLVFGAVFGLFLAQQPARVETVAPATVAALPISPQPVAVVAEAGGYSADAVYNGEQLFGRTCVACHGADAQGLPGLGKPLVTSEFIDSLDDAGLIAFLHVGRAANDPLNMTGVMMPARGGNMALTDDDLSDIVAYIRSLNGAPVMGAQSADALTEPPPAVRPFVALDINAIDPAVVPSSHAGSDGTFEPATTDGAAIFAWSCAGCHGDAATLTRNPAAAHVAELFTQPPAYDAAALESGAFVHPYRGGYPLLTDDQLAALAAYLQNAPGS